MERPIRSALGKELLAIVEQSLRREEVDIEQATEAYDEAIRRDNEKVIRQIRNYFSADKYRSNTVASRCQEKSRCVGVAAF